MNARFYNANTGRFLTQDTYRGNAYEPMSQNLYTYVGNNPINYVDPTGHWPEWNNLFNGTTLMVVGALAVAVGVTIATGGIAAPAAIAGVATVLGTVGAAGGVMVMATGAAETVAAFTGDNYILDDVYGGDVDEYNTAKTIYQVTAVGANVAAAVPYLFYGSVPIVKQAVDYGLPTKITGYTEHGLNQALSRDGVGVAPSAILDTINNPN